MGKLTATIAACMTMATSAAFAASNAIDTTVKYVLDAESYGALVASEARLNSTSTSQIVMDVGYMPGGADSNYLQILDPNSSYRVAALLSFDPLNLEAVATIPRSSPLLPNSFVTVSSSRNGAESSTIETWTGFPPQRVDSFSIAARPNLSASGVDKLDVDSSNELVFSSVFGLVVVNLESHAIQNTIVGKSCNYLGFVSVNDGKGKKIVCAATYDYAQIIDAVTGDVLLTSPYTTGGQFAAGAIHSTQPDELLAFGQQGDVDDVTFTPSWISHALPNFQTLPFEFNTLTLVDSNADGKADSFFDSGTLSLYSTADGTLISSFTNNHLCTGNVAVGKFSSTAGMKALCTSGPLTQGNAFVQAFGATSPIWHAEPHYEMPATPVVGHVMSASSVDVVTVAPHIVTSSPSALIVLNAQTLQQESLTEFLFPPPDDVVGVLQRVTLAKNASNAKADIIAASAHAIMKLVPGNSSFLWTSPDPHFVKALIPLDIDGDGQDEVVSVSVEQVTENVGGIWYTHLACYVRALNTVDGTQRWALSDPINGSPQGSFDYAIRAVPIDSAGTPGIVVACGGTLREMAGSDGSKTWEVADNATDLQVVNRDGENQLLVTDASHIARRSLATGEVIANLNGSAIAAVDVGSDDNLLVREADGTLGRLDATRGVFSDGPIPIGNSGEMYGPPSGLTLDTLSQIEPAVQLFANTTYGVVRVRTSKDASIFRDAFESSMTP